MNDTLILTGFGMNSYIASMAIAHSALPNADFYPVSKGSLAQNLIDLYSDGKQYQTIYILGISFLHHVDLLSHALGLLHDRGIKIVYFSIYNFQENHPLKNSLLFDFIFKDETNLESLVADYFHCNPQRIIELSYGKTYQNYILASAYAFRMFENIAPYKRMIHHIVTGDLQKKWTSSDLTLIAHYQLYGHRELKGKSEKINTLRKLIQKIAPTDSRVIILGESGTGKETIALHLYQQSQRKNESFIAFNCASVNEQLLEATFLGYEKGAFTGAYERKIGLFERANSGTLFLDEIGELPLNVQAVLLRILEEKRFSRIGSSEEIHVDVRIICATNRPLAQHVRDGRFRADLFFRLNTFSIHAIALRDHLEDLYEIVNTFWYDKTSTHFPVEKTAILKRYSWPGNVRELYHFLEQIHLFGIDEIELLLSNHIENMRPLFHDNSPLLEIKKQEIQSLDDHIKKYVKDAFNQCEKNYSKTAEKLCIAKNTLKKYLTE